MFLFRMHSVGSVRPKTSASNALIRWWNNADIEAAATSEAATSAEVISAPPTSEAATSALNQDNQDPNELEEDVVVIQEEEMVLVRKEVQDVAPHDPPQPQCIEPEPTVSAPAPSSKPKPKKKQQKRR